jgi:hypothetical protein
MLTVKGLMWGMLLNLQSCFSGHADEVRWFCPKGLCGSEYWSSLGAGQELTGHSEESSQPTFLQQPPKHFRDRAEGANARGLAEAGYLSDSDSGFGLGDSGYFAQTRGDFVSWDDMQNTIANNSGSALIGKG